MKTWADNAENRSPLERFDSFEAATARFDELRGMPYNSETAEPSVDGQPPARLTLGLESTDGMSAADILHVRQGKNYLVTDFVRMERLRDNPEVMGILARVSREIGFDLVRVREQLGDGRQLLSTVSFAEWDNPCFPSATPGRFAARYYDFMHQCYPLQKDDGRRHAWIEQTIQYIQFEGKRGTEMLAQAVAGLAAGLPDNAAVQEAAAALIQELGEYGGPEQADVQRKKPRHKKSQER